MTKQSPGEGYAEKQIAPLSQEKVNNFLDDWNAELDARTVRINAMKDMYDNELITELSRRVSEAREYLRANKALVENGTIPADQYRPFLRDAFEFVFVRNSILVPHTEAQKSAAGKAWERIFDRNIKEKVTAGMDEASARAAALSEMRELTNSLERLGSQMAAQTSNA